MTLISDNKPEGYKVLIVDDSRAILKALEDAFVNTSYRTTTTTDPVAACRMVEKAHFDIIISDIEMPGMNGLELLRKIKAYNGMIQVIVITGYITINNTLDAFRYGAFDLFFKPFDTAEVLSSVDMVASKLDRIKRLLAETAARKVKDNDDRP